MEVLSGTIASLRACAATNCAEAYVPPSGSADAAPLLPLQHCQLLLLLWHSMREAARGDALAQTASALCAAIAVASEDKPMGPSQWIALHRLLLLTHYMLRHFDAVPSHVPHQLSAFLHHQRAQWLQPPMRALRRESH